MSKPLQTKVGIAITGSVDSGKSSFVGVMKYRDLDDGNGSARVKVAKHPHEVESGKTSDISTRLIECDDNEHGVTFIDLCGHEKYLGTTADGIHKYFPDYAIVIIAANRGILRMTREHLGILFYLEIPVIIVITRVDLVAGTEPYTDTLESIIKLCKKNKKQSRIINTDKEFLLSPTELENAEKEARNKIVETASEIGENKEIVPIMTVSNKTGYYISVARKFIESVKPRQLWDASEMEGTIFYIDQVFKPDGHPVVLSGIVKGKTLKKGDIMYLGPNGKEFVPIRIKSFHNDNREEVSELSDHQRGCISVACTDNKIQFNKAYIKKGMIVVKPEKYSEKICYKFTAEIEILHHSATINTNYSPVVHYGPVCQSARITIQKSMKTNEDIINIDNTEKQKESLSTGDKAIVEFKFKFKPEFIETYEETGKFFFFREGTTRGRGKITKILPVNQDPDPTCDPIKTKKRIIRHRPRNDNNENKDVAYKLRNNKPKNIAIDMK